MTQKDTMKAELQDLHQENPDCIQEMKKETMVSVSTGTEVSVSMKISVVFYMKNPHIAIIKKAVEVLRGADFSTSLF